MDIIRLNHTCRQINLPLCRLIKGETCEYISRTGFSLVNFARSPATLIVLCVALTFTFRSLISTKRHYAAIGRKEFIMFFYLYICCISIDIFLISGSYFSKDVILYLTSVQLSFVNTAFLSLLIGGTAPVLLRNIRIFKSITIVKLFSFIYFIVSGVLVFTALNTKNGMMLFFSSFLTNFVMAILYYISQIIILKKNKSEVWGYGTLTIAMFFFTMASLILFYGSEAIVILSDGYLDGLFFFHTFMFCTIIMTHKYWLSVSDFEVECNALFMDKDEL